VKQYSGMIASKVTIWLELYSWHFWSHLAVKWCRFGIKCWEKLATRNFFMQSSSGLINIH